MGRGQHRPVTSSRCRSPLQLSPGHIWDVVRAQVNEAATAVGLMVAKMHNIGNGTGLALEASANGPSSPSQTDLNSFDLAAARHWMQQNAMPLKGSMHWGQFFEQLCRLKDPQDWAQMNQNGRNTLLAVLLQDQCNAITQGLDIGKAFHELVGVLAELRQ
ncbi:hypothetical protein BU23DRAFT_575172 [Bimuria novae-zelandiae CBS 107.79]|uniref:Uncharacterized protein n=1 Tax=Bimuria novae-zelandiae CBS 107.79 TaxID=1447943 RepID=A0A6A5UMM3_9PLEO|nr:hypothetical protein BU23DRAFT_575172 [Bimuria novae-zelandiae CBS 107.79]